MWGWEGAESGEPRLVAAVAGRVKSTIRFEVSKGLGARSRGRRIKVARAGRVGILRGGERGQEEKRVTERKTQREESLGLLKKCQRFTHGLSLIWNSDVGLSGH